MVKPCACLPTHVAVLSTALAAPCMAIPVHQTISSVYVVAGAVEDAASGHTFVALDESL